MIKNITFREWLVNHEIKLHEAGFEDSGGEWFFGNYLMPSDAFDFQYAYPYPSDYFFLGSRWKMDRKMGRKFINMDIDPIINQPIVNIKSNTMPGDESWEHKTDNRPNVTIEKNPWYGMIGIGSKTDDINKLVRANDLLDLKDKLNNLFGKFEPSYAQEAEDSIWIK